MRSWTLLALLITICGGLAWAGTGNERYSFGAHDCVDGDAICNPTFEANRCGDRRLPRVVESHIDFGSAIAVKNQKPHLQCYRKELTEHPLWINSAIWVDKKSEIMAVDTLQNRIFLYSVNGLGSPFTLQLEPKGDYVESTAKNPGSYILKLVGSKAMVLNKDLGMVERYGDFKKNHLGKANGLGSLYEWTVSGDRLFAFGFISGDQSGGKPFHGGFIEAKIGDRPFAVDDAELRIPYSFLDYYLLGFHYVTSLGNDGFFLKMNRNAELFRIPARHGQPKLVDAMPKEFASVPVIKTPAGGPGDAQKLFDEVGSYQIPVGIYGFMDKIYLLGRMPTVVKGISWWLYQIDPRTRLVEKLRLPTSAEYVTVVPSPKYWFLFEKGAVKKDGSQEISTVVAIPTSWITKPASSPLILKRPVSCLSSGEPRS